MIEDQQRPRYWLITATLAAAVALLALLCTLILPLFAPGLNRDSILGFPLGFYLVAQGIVLLIIVALSWLSSRQAQIDQKFGAIEDL